MLAARRRFVDEESTRWGSPPAPIVTNFLGQKPS
jgi:hypothetical protein